MVMVVMSLTYDFSAYPPGKLSDRLDRYSVIIIGIIFLIAADVFLGLADNLWILALGVALWGLHMGFTQGLLVAAMGYRHCAPTAKRNRIRGLQRRLRNFYADSKRLSGHSMG